MKLISRITAWVVIAPMISIAVPGARSAPIPTGCSGAIATFCGVSANCIEAGTVIAGSFSTPAGPVGGISNYAVLLNSFQVTSGDYILWGDTPASNLSSGILLDPTTGYITLPTGIFLVQYTVKFSAPPGTSNGFGYAALYQGPAGGPLVQIFPPVAISGISATTDDSNSAEPQVTGYALIPVTSAANNTIGLNLLLVNGMELYGTEGDENSELVIIQLR